MVRWTILLCLLLTSAMLTAAVPDDPRLQDQWHLDPLNDYASQVRYAWNVRTDADSILVAYIDASFGYHEDITDNLWVNQLEFNGSPDVDDDNNDLTDDIHGWNFRTNEPISRMLEVRSGYQTHGTLSLGLIGAVGDNGLGISGVCWDVQMMPVVPSGSAGELTSDGLAEAITYCVDMGAQVIGMVWAITETPTQDLDDAIDHAEQNDVLLVFGSHQIGAPPLYPQAYSNDNIIVTRGHNFAGSGHGFESTVWIDLSSPYLNLTTGSNDSYVMFGGTSSAGPVLTGVAALVRSEYPSLTASQVRSRIMDSVDLDSNQTGKSVTGGRLNAFKALAAPDSIPPAQIGNVSVLSKSSDSAILQWTAVGDDGLAGVASKYAIRYSDQPITEANFSFAEKVFFRDEPSSPGNTDQVEIEGLSAATQYYFAIKALDEWGVYGSAANVSTLATTSFYTSTPSDVWVSPADTVVTVQQDDTISWTIDVGNDGGGRVFFEFDFAEDWIDIDPRAAVVDSGATTSVDLTIDASLMTCGSYSPEITLRSNDPDGDIDLDYVIHASWPGVLITESEEYWHSSVDFGTQPVGSERPMAINFRNTGCTTLFVDSLTTIGKFSVASVIQDSVTSNDLLPVTVKYEPTVLGDDLGYLLAHYRVAGIPLVAAVSLVGTCGTPAMLTVQPDTLVSVELANGQVGVSRLWARNSGECWGEYNLEKVGRGSLGWLTFTEASVAVPGQDSVAIDLSMDATGFCSNQSMSLRLISKTEDDTSFVQLEMDVLPVAVVHDTLGTSLWDFGDFIAGQQLTPKSKTYTLVNSGCDSATVSVSVSGEGFASSGPATLLDSSEDSGGAFRVSFFSLGLPVGEYHGLVTVAVGGEAPSTFTLVVFAEVTSGAVKSNGAAPFVMAAPNPFNPQTTISYYSPLGGVSMLHVYDLRGRCVREVEGGLIREGTHRFSWDGRTDAGSQVSSGTYFYRITVDGEDLGYRGKVLLLK